MTFVCLTDAKREGAAGQRGSGAGWRRKKRKVKGRSCPAEINSGGGGGGRGG